ncbi:MAG TPA: LPXTG cell wall anchor domain-containing protein [Actinomycetota bacterium]|jgi:LPXTG-motif cell wall-anchored protein|nr:LPXTG cell wall anchor domain-containing protein [Actinomycetota bacterium]
MKIRSTVVALAAGIALFPAGAAVAGDLPDVPGIGAAQDQIDRAPRTPRRPSTDSLPGSGVIPVDTSRRAAAQGSGTPNRLPNTGVDTTALALDGLTLVGAGALLLTIRRRLATHS